MKKNICNVKEKPKNPLLKKSRLKRTAVIALVMMALLSMFAVNAFAADINTGVAEVDESLNAFNTILIGIVKFIGTGIMIFGGVRFGMSFQSNDPSQRSQGVMAMAAGVIVFFVPEIIKVLG